MHKGTTEMEKLVNKLTYSSAEGNDSEDIEKSQPKVPETEIMPLGETEHSGKRYWDKDIMEIDEENKKGKKLKVSSEHVLHIVQHSTSNIIVTSEKVVGT